MACVDPAEQDFGLIDNLPVIVNTPGAFTYILKGRNNSFEEEYDLKLTVNNGASYSCTFIVTDNSGKDSLKVTITGLEDEQIYNGIAAGNVLMVEQGLTSPPDKITFKGNNFSGLLEFVLALD